jgi:hypothetical protein
VAIKLATKTFKPSSKATKNPHPGPKRRTVFVAPAFPEPVLRMSVPFLQRTIIIDQETEPIK